MLESHVFRFRKSLINFNPCSFVARQTQIVTDYFPCLAPSRVMGAAAMANPEIHFQRGLADETEG